jgi:hypothetical protein
VRVRGGSAGLLAALERGICDPFDAKDPIDPPERPRSLSRAESREAKRREARRCEDYAKRKGLDRRAPF